ncbi:MAG TPA: SDR family oxidoreductase [Solirubrobacteraceae bacterium]|nr:SDR family oxidoreductase [Solirubrobacteraceae bacterium]
MARQPKSLEGKVVAITGAARGIGRATATALIGEGARVGIGDIDAQRASETAEELGGSAIGFELNVADRPSFERFLDEVERTLGPIDVLINNAGIMQLGPLVDEDDVTTLRMIDVNLIGVMTGCKLGIARLRPRGAGHIVNVASLAGKTGYAHAATYSATKHAVVGLSEALRAELRGSGIEISCVMPAVVHTELAAGLAQARGGGFEIEPADVAAAIVDALKLPRHDVFVPKSVVPIAILTAILPRRAREAIGRALKADQILSGADAGARAEYERRAAASDPSLEERRREGEIGARG